MSKLIEEPAEWTVSHDVGRMTRDSSIANIYNWAMANMQPGESVHGFSNSHMANPSRFPFHLRRRSCYVEGIVVRSFEVIVLRCGEVGKYILPWLVDVTVLEAAFSRRAEGANFQRDRAQHVTFGLYRKPDSPETFWIDQRDPSRPKINENIPAHKGWAARKIAAMMGWGEPFGLFTEHLSAERREEVLEKAAERGIYPATFNNLWSSIYNLMRDSKAKIDFLDAAEAREYTDDALVELYRLALDWRCDYPTIEVRDHDNEQLDAYREKFMATIEQMRKHLNFQI